METLKLTLYTEGRDGKREAKNNLRNEFEAMYSRAHQTGIAKIQTLSRLLIDGFVFNGSSTLWRLFQARKYF